MRLLELLEGVRETAPGRYIARCPAHEDRSPSLAIKDGEDGRVLIHCFAGCETENVLSAIGLTFSDVMPERIGVEHFYKPLRNRFDARQALQCIWHEALVVSVLAEDLANGKSLTDENQERLTLATSRISGAMDAVPPMKRPKEIRALRSPAR